VITQIEDYFARGCGRCARFDTPDCSTRAWAAGLAALRRLCLQAGLEEHVKWGHPCYVHAGRNIAIIGAFRDDFRLSFFDAALMKDPQGVLERQGPNTQHADMIRFTSNAAVDRLASAIGAYLAEAKGYAEAGIKPPGPRRTWSCPKNWSRRWTQTRSWPRPFTPSHRDAGKAMSSTWQARSRPKPASPGSRNFATGSSPARARPSDSDRRQSARRRQNRSSNRFK
jgi:uncharacterized protein YdeI (YjbR/CyaY-like superfamily)